jgi:hypothetical protein
LRRSRLWDFFARQIGWIENRRATQAHRLLPGMKIKSSGDAARPRRQIPLRFSHFATKGEIRRESSGGREVIAVDLRRRNFTSSGSITDIAALSLLERIDNGAPSIRHESTRSERKTWRSGRHPMIWASNGAYSKQRDETEAYGKA